MPAIDLPGGGAALLLVGLAWVPIGYLAHSTALMLAGVAIASVGVVVAGFAPPDESERLALDAEDLEDS